MNNELDAAIDRIISEISLATSGDNKSEISNVKIEAKNNILDWHSEQTERIIGEDEYSWDFSYDASPVDNARNELREEQRQSLKQAIEECRENKEGMVRVSVRRDFEIVEIDESKPYAFVIPPYVSAEEVKRLEEEAKEAGFHKFVIVRKPFGVKLNAQ